MIGLEYYHIDFIQRGMLFAHADEPHLCLILQFPTFSWPALLAAKG